MNKEEVNFRPRLRGVGLEEIDSFVLVLKKSCVQCPNVTNHYEQYVI